MDLPTADLPPLESTADPYARFRPPVNPSSSSGGGAALIGAAALEEHLTKPNAWRALPDGRPLRLTAAGLEFLLDDFDGHDPRSLRSAHRVLFFATRTELEMEELWVPPVPTGEDEDRPEPPALHLLVLQAQCSAWAAQTFEPGAAGSVMRLATALWDAVVLRLPVSAEKKSPPISAAPAASAKATSRTCAGSSAGTMTLSGGRISPPTSSPSSPPSSRGATRPVRPSPRSPKRKPRAPKSARTSRS